METPFNPKESEDKSYAFKPFRVPKYQVKFKNAKELGNVDNMVWYTPAALYLWGGFTDVTLSEILSRKELKILWYKFDKPIFKNFGAGWDNLLWAAKAEDWNDFVENLLEAVQFDIENKLLYQYGLQEISILDPLSVDKERIALSTTPKIPIKAFAVLSNTGQMAFDLKAKKKEGSLPGMSLFKPDPLHVTAANVLFKDKNISTEDAVGLYKSIMKKLENASYAAASERKWKAGVKNKKTGEGK